MSMTNTKLNIQWKGTDACIDLNCVFCGKNSHYDGYINYAVECPHCHIRYRVSTVLQIDAWLPGDPDPTLFDI